MGIRADNAVVLKGFARSRARAKEMIERQCFTYEGKPVTKPSQNIEDIDLLEMVSEDIPYVSRGGLKLEKALTAFNIDVKGAVCVDIGASTGGFTDCLLQNGAKYVFAVDCGHDQLSEVLKQDPRVKNMEGVNARSLEKEDLGCIADIVVCDASFISLTLLLPAMEKICKENGSIICLIKPQFEAGKEALNKKGVVNDPKDRARAVDKVTSFARELGLKISGLTESPIKGPNGNTEYLLYLKKELSI